MRTFFRIGAVTSLTVWMTMGCGNVTATSGGGGSGGSAGNAGTAGTAATGGTGGTAAAGGTSGAGGSSGAGGTFTVAPCPDRTPNDGGLCAREGLHCEYGDDPRGDACRTHATCTSSRWQVTEPDSNSCPSIDHATCNKPAGSACSTPGSYCVQPEGGDCQCTTCPPTAPVCTVGITPTLYCNTNTTPGCPAGEPNLGTACTAPEGQECAYCPDDGRVCSHGIWTAGKACVRPL
jgi:hypothetical protein